MIRKNILVGLLLFFYTVVLTHNSVPHGHFDELFQAVHVSDSHDHSENNDHHHHYLFSHSIFLHVILEKQSIIAPHQQDFNSKETQQALSVFVLPQLYQPCSFTGSYFPQRIYEAGPPALFKDHSIINRGPPAES